MGEAGRHCTRRRFIRAWKLCPRRRQHCSAAEGNRKDLLSLGVSGFGPLSELAVLREYLTIMKPRTVLWLYFEGNDLTEDLPFERHVPILRAYLDDPVFRQGLIERRQDVKVAMKAFLDAKMVEAMNRFDSPHEA